MNKLLKLLNGGVLAIVLSWLAILPSSAQVSYDNSIFDWCNGTPQLDEVLALNNYLANFHAPVYKQYSKSFSHRHLDKPVAVDFDGDFNSSNNWDNAPTFAPDADPTVYYAVLWTEKHFIITYSFFFPRDYSVCPFGWDEHNNDLERVVVTIDRCTQEAAIVTTHHSKESVDKCVEPDEMIVETDGDGDGDNVPEGNHPCVFASAGSHAIYLTVVEAFFDSPLPCDPQPTDFAIYFPGAIPSSTGDLAYTLVDIFEIGGLWSMRSTPSLFTGDNFTCNGNDACQASAPWNGSLGRDPRPFLYHEVNRICGNSLILPWEEYVYNPYTCSYAASFTISDNPLIIPEGETTITFDSYDGDAPSITWFPSGGLRKRTTTPSDPSHEVTLFGKLNEVQEGTYTIEAVFSGTGTEEYAGLRFCTFSTDLDVVIGVALSFHLENSFGVVLDNYCDPDEVYIDAAASQGEDSYSIELLRRLAGTNDPFTSERVFGPYNTELPDLIPLVQWASDRGYDIEEGYEYEVKITISGPLNAATKSKTFTYGGEANADFILENDEGEPTNDFCQGEEVRLNGEQITNVDYYRLVINRRPLGTTANIWNSFYPGTRVYDKVGTIIINDVLAADNLALEAGFEYNAVLSVRTECGKLAVSSKSFGIYHCPTNACTQPENLDCEDAETSDSRYLTWNPVPGANSYRVQIIGPNNPQFNCACRERENAVSDQIIPTSEARLFLTPLLYNACFQWRVQAYCGEEESPYSELRCYYGRSTSCGSAAMRIENGHNHNQFEFSGQQPSGLQANAYPNPVKDVLNVAVQLEEAGDLSIRLYNLQGQMVRQLWQGKTTDGLLKKSWPIDNQLAAGLYLVEFQTALESYRQKIFITR